MKITSCVSIVRSGDMSGQWRTVSSVVPRSIPGSEALSCCPLISVRGQTGHAHGLGGSFRVDDRSILRTMRLPSTEEGMCCCRC